MSLQEIRQRIEKKLKKEKEMIEKRDLNNLQVVNNTTHNLRVYEAQLKLLSEIEGEMKKEIDDRIEVYRLTGDNLASPTAIFVLNELKQKLLGVETNYSQQDNRSKVAPIDKVALGQADALSQAKTADTSQDTDGNGVDAKANASPLGIPSRPDIDRQDAGTESDISSEGFDSPPAVNSQEVERDNLKW